MAIYWSFFVLSILCLLIESLTTRSEMLTSSVKKTKVFAKKELMIAMLVVLPIIFFVSFRDEVMDTYAYVEMYDSLPTGWDRFSYIANNSAFGYGFTLLATICKTYLSSSHYFWFFLLALINLYCIIKVCVQYSPNLAFSLYLFVAGTTFTWCLNGTRQFLVVTLLFLLSKFLLNDCLKNKILYIFFIIICSNIHVSCIFLIPIVLFISSKHVYGKGMLLIVLGTVIGTMFSDSVFAVAGQLMDKDYSESLQNGKGSSILRLLFVFLPSIITIFKYNTVKRIAPPAIILGINMSLVGACFMFAATFTNGILIGRMPAYFTIYNLYVIPWLLYNCFGSLRTIAINVFVLVYGIWFYFQMCIAWHGLPYVSKFLNLYL